MSLTEITRVYENHLIQDTSIRKLYTLAELRDEGGSGYDRALEWVAQWTTDYEWWDTALDEIGEVFKACGFDYKSSEVEFDLDRGDKFVLPRNTSVDEALFLKAFKIYLSGVDVRIPLLGFNGGERTAIKATGTQIRKLDLRSKDARIIREQGLVVHRVDGMWGNATREFDLDYHYEGLSELFAEDANEFLSDLCHSALTALRDEFEYLMSEESLLEHAEVNEYHFDINGRIA